MTKEKLYTTGMLGRMFNLKRVTVTRRCSGVRGKDRWGAEKIDTIDGKRFMLFLKVNFICGKWEMERHIVAGNRF